MQRRILIQGMTALAAAICVPTVRAEQRLGFDELYEGRSVLGLKLSAKLRALTGSRVTIEGFMAPPLKADAPFFVLTREPVSLCPFCNTDADWPDSIILVKLRRAQDFVQANRPILVTGRLESGSQTDESTGFVSLVRLTDAQYRISP